MQSYGPPKLRESQLWEFWDSHLGVSGQNDIWVLVPWLSTKNTIRGKVVASLKSRLWWVLWVVFPCGSSLHQNCFSYALTNLLFGLCKSVWVGELLVNPPSLILELQHTPTPFFVVFTFGLIVESIKEFGGASIGHIYY